MTSHQDRDNGNDLCYNHTAGGYPTDEALQTLRKLANDYTLFSETIDFIYDIWYSPLDGVIADGDMLYLHTWGWSGNEDIINALSETMFWHMHWQRSDRGGHYTFKKMKVKGDDDDKK